MLSDRLLIIAGLLLLSIVVGILMSPLMGASILVLLPVILGGAGHPRSLGILLFVWIAWTGSLFEYWLPIRMARAASTYGTFAFMAVLVGANVLMNRKRILENGTERFVYILFTVFFLISTLISRIELFAMGMYVKNYFFYIAAYLYALLFFKRQRDCRLMFRFLIVFTLVQLVLNLGWLSGINPLPTRPLWNDVGIGTIGAQESVAYFSLMMMVMGYAWFINAETGRSARQSIVFMVVSAILLVSTFTAHALLMAVGVMGLAVFALLFVSRRAKTGLIVSCVLGVLVFAGGFLRLSEGGENLYETLQLTPDEIQQPYEKFKTSDKVQSYKFSFIDIPEERPMSLFLGTGPGTYMTVPALNYPTALTYRYVGQFFLTYSGAMQRAQTSVSQQPIVGICAMWTELGVIGFSCYLFFFIYPAVVAFRRVRKGLVLDRYQKIIALTLPFAVLIFLIQNLLWDHFCVNFFTMLLGYWAGIAGRIHPSEPIADEEVNELEKVQAFRPPFRRI